MTSHECESLKFTLKSRNMYNIFDDKGNRSFWYFLIPIRGLEAMNLNNPISTQVLFDALEIGGKFFVWQKLERRKSIL